MDRRTERELMRLEGLRKMRMAEATMAFQYGDHVRSLWHQNEAAKITQEMVKVRREGVPLPSRKANEKAIARYNRLYPQAVELVF